MRVIIRNPEIIIDFLANNGAKARALAIHSIYSFYDAEQNEILFVRCSDNLNSLGTTLADQNPHLNIGLLWKEGFFTRAGYAFTKGGYLALLECSYQHLNNYESLFAFYKKTSLRGTSYEYWKLIEEVRDIDMTDVKQQLDEGLIPSEVLRIKLFYPMLHQMKTRRWELCMENNTGLESAFVYKA